MAEVKQSERMLREAFMTARFLLDDVDEINWNYRNAGLLRNLGL
jgi:hypothetical protein